MKSIRFLKGIITLFLIFQVFLSTSYFKITGFKYEKQNIKAYAKSSEHLTSINLKDNNSQEQKEVINVVKNGREPIKLVIEVDGLDCKYVNLKETTEVNKSDIDLYITFKNIDILTYEDAYKFNKSQIAVTTNKHNWHIYGKNLIPEPNTIHYGISIDKLSNRVCNVTINKVFNKSNKQILVRPITFKLKVSKEMKSSNE